MHHETTLGVLHRTTRRKGDERKQERGGHERSPRKSHAILQYALKIQFTMVFILRHVLFNVFHHHPDREIPDGEADGG